MFFNHSRFIYSHCSTPLSNDNAVLYLLLKDVAECVHVGEIPLSLKRIYIFAKAKFKCGEKKLGSSCPVTSEQKLFGH